MLRSDLGGKGLGYYFLVPHKEGVSSAFVCVVLGLCIPQDVGIVTFNGPLVHRKRCTRADGPSLPIVVFSLDSEKLGLHPRRVARVGFEDVWNTVLDFAFMRYEAITASNSPFPTMDRIRKKRGNTRVIKVHMSHPRKPRDMVTLYLGV